MTETNFNKLLNNSLSEQRIPYASSTEESWDKMLNRIRLAGHLGSNSKISQNTTWARLAVAAGLAVLIALSSYFYFNPETENRIETFSAHSTVALPDGSLAELNAGSTLKYSTDSWEHERKLNLSGEAFFEVMHGPRFEVETKHGQVVVKGTSFNVYCRLDSFSVACSSGEVLVRSNKNEVTLLKGEVAWLVKDSLKKASSPEFRPLWRNNIYEFSNSTIFDVLHEIELQFGTEVDASAITDTLRYTGQFSGENLTDALELVCTPLGLEYSIDKNTRKVTLTD